jgi:hypothetical protein
MNTVKVGIIGNARNIPPPADAHLFSLMCKKATHIITDQLSLSLSDVVLVSGGAAWGDHVAVALYLEHRPLAGLELHIPCAWSSSNKAYEDTGSTDWRVNPGHLANSLHRSFAAAVSRETLTEIEMAKHLGAVLVDTDKGFHARNTAIAASSDYLIAFTSDETEPISGGTADTWKKFTRETKRRVHVNIPSLLQEEEKDQ